MNNSGKFEEISWTSFYWSYLLKWDFRFLATEICKNVSKVDPFFSYKNFLYNFKRAPVLPLSAAKAVVFGKNVVHFKSTLIWNSLPYLVICSTSVFKLKSIHVRFENISHFSAARMSLLVILLLLVFISHGYLVDKQ